MPTDAQTLCDLIAVEGYNKLSKRALLEAILAAVAGGGGGGACAAQSGAGSPVGSVTPAFIGQLYHDTVADAYWRSTGLTAADWTAIGGGGSPGIITILASDLDDLQIVSDTVDTNINCPDLLTINNTIKFDASSSITIIDTPLLVTVSNDLSADSCSALTAWNLSSLVSAGNVFIGSCPLLTVFSPVSWIPSDGTVIDFNGDALNATSVELILRRCVLAGVTTCNINLSGGTNAGTASLNAQGQADVVTLGAQLTINP